MDKSAQLQHIANEIKECSQCKIGTTGKAVEGEGNPNAKIVFVGEAPGKQESLTGRPFIGRSGKLLREAIHKIGIDPAEVYITSPVKYLPIKGTPSPSQIKHGTSHLRKQLAVIQPQLIVLMGATACRALLKENLWLTDMHGKLFNDDASNYFVTFHPAAALRFPRIRALFLEDFQKLHQIILTLK